jgi:tetratricopeptide (TPR) repeat protein
VKLAGAFLIGLLCAAVPATGAAQAEVDDARGHFTAARSHFDRGDYESALREFDAAYRLSPQAEILYNLSLVHERLGQIPEALDALRRYLASDAPIENRELLEIRARNFEARAARLASGDPDPGPEPPPADDAVAPPPEDDSAAPPPPIVVVDEDDGVPLGAIVAYVAAGAGLAAFGVLGMLAVLEYGDVEDRCGAARACADGDLDRTHALALGADIGLGAAIVGAVVGTVFVLAQGGDDESAAGGVAVHSWIGPHALGAAAEARF